MVNLYMLRCAVGAALVMACAAASAASTFQGSLTASGLSGAGLGNTSGLATTFDAGTGLASSLSLDTQTAAAVAASDATEARRRTQSTTSAFDSASASSSSLQLQLWNLVANVRAQQTSNQFDAVVASAAHIDQTVNDLPAPVPLPPAAWLFLAGLGVVVGLQRSLRRESRDLA